MNKKFRHKKIEAGNYTVTDDKTVDSVIGSLLEGAIDFRTAQYYIKGGN